MKAEQYSRRVIQRSPISLVLDATRRWGSQNPESPICPFVN